MKISIKDLIGYFYTQGNCEKLKSFKTVGLRLSSLSILLVSSFFLGCDPAYSPTPMEYCNNEIFNNTCYCTHPENVAVPSLCVKDESTGLPGTHYICPLVYCDKHITVSPENFVELKRWELENRKERIKCEN